MDDPASATAPLDARHGATLERGLAVLASFSGQRASESVADIADRLGLNRTTAHRYITTLQALGYLDQRLTSPRYRLRPLAAEMGRAAIATIGLRQAAGQALTNLRRESSCTARLAVRLDLDALIIGQSPSRARGQGLLGLDTRPGARLPGYCTALGRALIADLDLGSLSAELQAPALRRKSELDRARHLGYAIEDEEHEAGVFAIAVPVRARGGETVAAVDILGAAPEVSLATLVNEHLPLLRRAALQIGESIEELPLR